MTLLLLLFFLLLLFILKIIIVIINIVGATYIVLIGCNLMENTLILCH